MFKAITSNRVFPSRANRLTVGALTIAVSLFWTFKSLGGGISEDISLLLLWRPLDAIVLAQFDPADRHVLQIIKSYDGALKTGDRINVPEDALGDFDISTVEPKQSGLQRFVLTLQKKHLDKSSGYTIPVGGDWSTYTLGCRRIIDGKVYDWSLYQTAPATPLTLLSTENASTLADVEAQIAYGLGLRERLTAANATIEPQKKLARLAPFFVPSANGKFTPYMVWRMTSENLDEVDKTGGAAIPFYEGLLKLPSYQSNFNPDGWIGFGAQQRIRVEQRLRLQKARLEGDPARKVAALAPLFVLPEFEFRAGCDGDYLLTAILDKTLAELEKAGPAAIPLLEEVLTREYFQPTERLKSGRRNPDGRERGEKVEMVLNRLKAQR